MGVYGQLAQSVQPNPKCESCLHYDAQRGLTGVCQVGLRPAICGEGEAPLIGFAPAHKVSPNVLLAHATGGGAAEQASPTTKIAMRVMALGEESVEMVKSDIMRLQDLGACAIHAARTIAYVPHEAAQAVCTCSTPRLSQLVKSLEASLTNYQKAMIGSNVRALIVPFVRGVAAGQDLGDIRKSLNEDCVAKGYYGSDWLSQFQGTEHFDDAHKLCEEELAIAEENLKARIARRKIEKERSAMMAKLAPQQSWDYEEGYQKEDALRIRKQKLELKLAKTKTKTIAASNVKKSDEPSTFGSNFGAKHDVAVDRAKKASAAAHAATASARTASQHEAAGKLHARAADAQYVAYGETHEQNRHKKLMSRHYDKMKTAPKGVSDSKASARGSTPTAPARPTTGAVGKSHDADLEKASGAYDVVKKIGKTSKGTYHHSYDHGWPMGVVHFTPHGGGPRRRLGNTEGATKHSQATSLMKQHASGGGTLMRPNRAKMSKK